MATSKVPKRFIAPIDNSGIEAGANIDTTKLADGANFLKKDGSVAMTGALNAGSNRITNVATPAAGTDATNRDYVDNKVETLNSIFSSKGSARAMATGNVLLSNPGTSVFDTVTLVSGDRLFLGSQTAPAENGLYVFNGSGVALTRTEDANLWDELQGSLFSIDEGAANIGKLILFTVPKAGTINTTAITYQVVNSAGLANSNFVTNEVVAGTVNGSNTAFTLANTPTAGSDEIFIEGHLLKKGAGNDYTITGATITMLTAPLTGEVITANYRK